MAADILRKTPLITIVAVFVVLLGLVVRASLKNENLDTKFRLEMANRFDLEKKVLSLEKERAGLYARIEALAAQIETGQDAINDLQASLSLVEQENKGLKEELSQLPGRSAAPTTTAASDVL